MNKRQVEGLIRKTTFLICATGTDFALLEVNELALWPLK
jgi:hypothetical protein